MASVTGVLEGCIFRRAQTAGLVVHRSIGIAAIVTGGAAGRAPMASIRAHTMGLVVQRAVCEVARRAGAGLSAGVVARWACCAFKRAHTAGLLEHAALASLSDGANQIRMASSAGPATRDSRAASLCAWRLGVFHASLLESANVLSGILQPRLGNAPL